MFEIEQMQNAEHIGLNLKMSNYTRSKMISGVGAQVNGKVDISTVFAGEGTSILESDFRSPDLTSKGKDNGTSKIMEQHTINRDYSQSR